MPRSARAAVRSYLELWRAPRPTSLTGREVLTARNGTTRVHRDIVLHGRAGIPRVAWAPLSMWLWARWRTAGPHRIDAELARLSPDRTEMAGLPMAEVRLRLGRLARTYGVPVWEGLSLGLFRDGWADRWADYAYDVETTWNLVVSRRLGVTAGEVEFLTDKRRTARVLGALGIAVVPEIATTRPGEVHDVHAAVQRWLDEAGTPGIHLKRVAGSRGEGAFEVRRAGAEGVEVIPYQDELPVSDPVEFIAERLAEAPYMVQPRLETHPALADLADPGDVVTARVVTLYPGADRRVFSCVLEVPLPVTHTGAGRDRRYYSLLPVDRAGTIRGGILPEWLQRKPDPEPDAGDTADTPLSGKQRTAQHTKRVESALIGTPLPLHAELLELALRAHEACPRVFSVAWDVALTPNGWVLLEGNSGYGVLHPQMAEGPILVHAPEV